MIAAENLESGVISRRNVEIVKGNGSRIWDGQGNEYIDMGASYGVCNVGHCNPDVVRAVREQVGVITHISSSYDNPARTGLMRRLVDISPPGLSRVFLCNSGTESVEAALKFSIHHTGRRKLVAAKRSFHGRTLGSLSVTWDPKHGRSVEGTLSDVDFVRYGDPDDLEDMVDENTAALILEPVQGEGGVHPAPEGYLSEARRICDERGALLVIDEVQTGIGRTGSVFAIERDHIFPDILCVGKSLGGGIPIAATLLQERLGPMPRGLHGSTFGGNPVACAAANAVLDFLVSSNLSERAGLMGNRLIEGLNSIQSPLIREVRGVGLMAAVELKKKAGPYLSAMMEKGVAAIPSGSTVIRLLPPLVVDEEEIDRTVRIIGEVLNG